MGSRSERVAVCIRIVDAVVVATSLAVAGLSSAIAHVSKVLYNRARSDLINAIDAALNGSFMSTMTSIIVIAVVAASVSVTVAVFGLQITICPSWLRKRDEDLLILGATQLALAICIVATGALIADDVHSVQTLIGKFGGNDSFPYYDIMYYGGVAQAASGCALVVMKRTSRRSGKEISG
ncbi:hypothetical protein F4680DRAFT_410902 [Xylaria scruposa]|nr:hypothetical protein F4680DRAFT_410902 [Xylaria scruposa]